MWTIWKTKNEMMVFEKKLIAEEREMVEVILNS